MSDAHDRPDPDNPIDATVAAIIRRKANRMVGRAGLRPQDRADLEHELVLRVLARRDRFTEGRGTWPAFVCSVVERAGANVLRARGRAWRARGPTEPLTEGVAEPDGTGAHALAADLARAMEALPAELRAVAELLRTHTMTGVARVLGISRSTVYARVHKIRARPEWAALARDR